MWVNLARVTPEAFDRIRRDPQLLGPLTPASAKQAAVSSAALDLDDDAKAIVKVAGERGHYIVGLVS